MLIFLFIDSLIQKRIATFKDILKSALTVYYATICLFIVMEEL